MFAHRKHKIKTDVCPRQFARDAVWSHSANMRLKLREHRKRLNWTIDHLADVSGLSRGFISQLENGRRNPGADTLVILSTALDTPLAALIEDEGLGDDLPGLIADLMNLDAKGISVVRTIVRAMQPPSSG